MEIVYSCCRLILADTFGGSSTGFLCNAAELLMVDEE